MKTNNLLASVALFRKLYDKEDYSNIYDILAEFIRGAVIYEKKLAYTSEEIKNLLKKVYGFDIPDSVIKTTLRNRFNDKVSRADNIYYFNKEIKENFDKIEAELETVNIQNGNLIDNLYAFISAKLEKDLSNDQKEKIFENFTHFAMDNGYSDDYSDLISAFVISNSTDHNFTSNLNSIKEGIILYQGISYTADLNDLGRWETDLDIYLAPEHLFHALGYNGILFEEIFNDFYNLVSDINKSNKPTSSKRSKKIRLFYLPETKLEIDNFFLIAESIINGQKRLDPSKTAMENIIKGANSISDIKVKQVNFFNQLQKKDIIENGIEFDPVKHAEYNVVDQTIIEGIEAEAKKNKRYFDEDFCYAQLNLFSKINLKRGGKNSFPFEKISHIYLTDNAVSKYLAHNNKVKFEKNDTAFAKDIDFAISRFWFKLKKGFNTGNHVPKSFDLINKAKIIISSYINSSIATEYHKINIQYKTNHLTQEDVIRLNIELKEKINLPELIDENNIEDALNFLDDENLIASIRKENERKETLLNDTRLELAIYKKRELEQIQIERKKIEDAENLNIAVLRWSELLNKRRKAFLYFIAIVMLNGVLAALAFLFAFNTDMKNWLMLFKTKQIVMSATYVLLVLIEIIGSKYIFNKGKIKEGFNFMIGLFSMEKRKGEFISLTVAELNSENLISSK